MKKFAGTGFLASSVLYLVASYLLLLRDGNFITRLAHALNTPDLIDQSALLVNQIDRSFIHPNALSLIFLLLGFAGMFFFYLKLLSVKLDKYQSNLLVFSIIFIFLSFPSLSTDVFDYHATNRVIFSHNANPWKLPPNQFVENDPIINLGSWIHRPAVYPPLSIALNSLVYLLFGSHPLMAVIGFKIQALIFYLGITYLIRKLAKHHGQNTTKSQLLFALNPLILTEFLGNAHNDLSMIFFFILSLYLINLEKLTYTGVAFALSVLSKITIFLYLPIISWLIYKKGNLKYTLKFLTPFVLVLLSGAAFLRDSHFEYLATLRDQNQTLLQSFPYTLKIISENFFGISDPTLSYILLIPLLIFSLVYAKTFFTKNKFTDNLALIMLTFLFIQITMLHPWYFSWVIVLIPFITSPKLRWIVLITTVSGMLRYFVYNLSLYYMPFHPFWQITIYLAVVLPVLIMISIPSRWYTEIRNFKILT